jgi:hypothetical protein
MPAQRVPRGKGQVRASDAAPSVQPDPMVFRISRLELTNVKCIDSLVLDFRPPILPDDPDVHVIGSANGVGKTTVLEAIALMFMPSGDHAALAAVVSGPERHGRWGLLDLPDAMVRHSERWARCQAWLDGADVREVASGGWRMDREASGGIPLSLFGLPRSGDAGSYRVGASFLATALSRLMALSPEPFLAPGCAYFHSYRQVRSAGVDLGGQSGEQGTADSVSLFKEHVVETLLAESGVLGAEAPRDDDAMHALSRLTEAYAGGTIGHLRPGPDRTYDLRVARPDGSSFSFNALSSGQKEIISTLFLIWLHTRNSPSVVLIDEPELHLNAEWHRGLVRQLHELAPANQYILATHSEDIVASVLPERRIMLVPDEGE